MVLNFFGVDVVFSIFIDLLVLSNREFFFVFCFEFNCLMVIDVVFCWVSFLFDEIFLFLNCCLLKVIV